MLSLWKLSRRNYSPNLCRERECNKKYYRMDIIYVCVYVYARIERNAKEDVSVSAGVIVITLRYRQLAVPSSLFVPVLS